MEKRDKADSGGADVMFQQGDVLVRSAEMPPTAQPRDAVNRRLRAVLDIQAERLCQDDLRDKGRFPYTAADPGIANELPAALLDHCVRYSILGEEVGETGHALNEWANEEHRVRLAPGGEMSQDRRTVLRGVVRKELVQVAAVCLAWLEAIEVA